MLKLAGIPLILSFKLSRKKEQLNPSEFSKTQRVETAAAVPPLQGRRALSLDPGGGRGRVERVPDRR